MPILVTDFDGTFTRRDYFDLILERHDPPGAREGWQRFLDGKSTHAEGIGAVFAALKTDEATADALVDALDPAPGTAAAVRRLQAASWQVVIASAGCRWYIERLLDRLDLSGITVHASPGTFRPDTGLVMRPDPAGPFHDPDSGIDKPAVVRAALAGDPVVAYAGDSNTDRAAALLVPPERRFITGWLGRRFRAEGIDHVAVTAWPEIAARLLGDASPT
jgi:2-hydroxy-3-keto-5-methylthiopentenyl-1-phosphate phosphatase